MLTNDQIKYYAPSAFADSPAGDVSSEYVFLDTMTVVDTLKQSNWLPVSARESYTRKDDYVGHNVHEIKFRNPDIDFFGTVGELIPEIGLLNSHNRYCAFQLHGGLFRLVCTNGMTVSEGDISFAKQKHIDTSIKSVLDQVDRITDNMSVWPARVESMKIKTLSPLDQFQFALEALKLAWPANENFPITPQQVLESRRDDDKGNCVWLTFNRIQENVIKGGVKGKAQTGRALTTRPVSDIRRDVKFNTHLWELAENFAIA